MSKRLKERVLEVIGQLDYYPDHAARSLKIKQTRTIGLVVSDITDPIFPQVMRGAEDAAWDANYTLITFNSGDQPQREQQVLDALRCRRVDGILLVAAAGSDPARIKAIQISGTPVVCLDHELMGVRVDSVIVDNFGAARDGVRHLASLEHRRIGLLPAELTIAVARDRYSGYRQALDDAGLSYDAALVVTSGPRLEDALCAVRELLSRSPRPSAVLSCSMMLAMGLLRAVRELDLRCPEELAIATFEDPPFAEALTPPLTAIGAPSYEVGRRGVELLLKRIEEPQRRCTKVVLPTTLRVRASCGANGRVLSQV